MKKIVLLSLALLCFSCSSVHEFPLDPVHKKITEVSYYSDKFNGRKTASGETFNNKKLTAANRILPFGTKVLLTNTKTGKTVVVRINDRGPFAEGRKFDITKAAFKKIGDLDHGVLSVYYKILK